MTNRSWHRSAKLACLTPLLIALSGLSGCGDQSGPQRYKLSGAVTHGGKPIPAGMILFAPDVSQGNGGPGVMVEFSDGRYQTPSGKGTVGGPHVVRIAGYSGDPAAGGDNAEVRPLFAEYELNVDLPRQDASHNFDVPGQHK